MKGLVCLTCLALLFLPTALAEDDAGKLIDALDLSGLESVSKDAGALFDLRQLLRDLASGQATLDPEAIAGMLRAAFLREWRESASLLAGMLVPALLSAVAACLAKRRAGTEAAGLVCYLACASACGARVLGLAKEASALVGHTVAVGNAVFPLLTALLSATGASGAASMLTPASALFASVCVSLLQSVGLRLGVAAAGMRRRRSSLPRPPRISMFLPKKPWALWRAWICWIS